MQSEKIINQHKIILPDNMLLIISKPILKPVVFCTSQRFKEEVQHFMNEVNKLTNLWILKPDFRRHRKKMIKKSEPNRLKAWSYKTRVPGMAMAHAERLRKVKAYSGTCFIYNPGGYVGWNTFGEFFMTSQELHMPIFALEPHYEDEVIFDEFVDFFVSTPEEFVEKQKLFGVNHCLEVKKGLGRK